MLIRAEKEKFLSRQQKGEWEGGEEGEIRREEKEMKDEADSPGLWSATADKVDQNGTQTCVCVCVCVCECARAHTHTHTHE